MRVSELFENEELYELTLTLTVLENSPVEDVLQRYLPMDIAGLHDDDDIRDELDALANKPAVQFKIPDKPNRSRVIHKDWPPGQTNVPWTYNEYDVKIIGPKVLILDLARAYNEDHSGSIYRFRENRKRILKTLKVYSGD